MEMPPALDPLEIGILLTAFAEVAGFRKFYTSAGQSKTIFLGFPYLDKTPHQ